MEIENENSIKQIRIQRSPATQCTNLEFLTQTWWKTAQKAVADMPLYLLDIYTKKGACLLKLDDIKRIPKQKQLN